MHWKKVTLIGVGLLGGSLGLALKQRRLAELVVGFVRRTASIGECQRLGAVDWATRDLVVAVAQADLVVFCTPIAQMQRLAEQILPALGRGMIVTDVGSVKGSVVQALETVVARAGAHFVGSHPMAGGEKMGVAAARADLFENSVCVITPTTKSNRTAVRQLERLWRSVGSRVLKLTPGTHDELVSRSSHLPHVVAAQLVNFVLSRCRSHRQSALCANGFRDTTRIASGSPEMWRDIALANRENLSQALGEFMKELQQFQSRLERADAEGLARFFEQAKARRDRWSRKSASSSPE